MRMRMLLAVVTVTCLAAGVSSQQRPDFSGTWVVTTDAPRNMAAAPSAVLGQRIGLRHDGDRLVITRSVTDDVMAVTFPLDGSRTSYRVPGRVCESDRE